MLQPSFRSLSWKAGFWKPRLPQDLYPMSTLVEVFWVKLFPLSIKLFPVVPWGGLFRSQIFVLLLEIMKYCDWTGDLNSCYVVSGIFKQLLGHSFQCEFGENSFGTMMKPRPMIETYLKFKFQWSCHLEKKNYWAVMIFLGGSFVSDFGWHIHSK